MNFATMLPKILKWTEIIGLALFVFSLVLKMLQYTGGNELLMIGLLTMAASYYLSSFVKLPLAEEKTVTPKGLADNMVLVVRKVLFMGLSVFCVAYLFGLLHWNGANEMMIIGLGTLLIASLVAMFLIFGKRERMPLIQDPLLRSVLAIGLFLVYKIL